MEGELNAALEQSAADKTGLERQFSLQTVSGQGGVNCRHRSVVSIGVGFDVFMQLPGMVMITILSRRC